VPHINTISSPLISIAEPSRCGDMLSLLHLALFLLGKEQEPGETLCLDDLPPQFQTYYNSIRSLGPDEKPNYDNLREIFRDAFYDEGFLRDYRFLTPAVDARELDPKPSQEQLVAGFKHIYERLLKAETLCLDDLPPQFQTYYNSI
jgi:hypothetical protein